MNKSYLYSIVFIILFVLDCYYLTAQDRYFIQSFNSDNGMPANGLRGLQWDENTHFLWMASDAGLVRYDGYNLKTFNTNNTSIIKSNRLVFIDKNEKGEIYFADEKFNLFYINKNLPKQYNKEVNNNAYNNQLNKYFSLRLSNKLFKELNQKEAFINSVNITDPYHITILKHSDTSCLLWNNEHLYFYNSGKHFRIYNNTTEGQIQYIFKTNNCYFYVSKNNQVYYIDTNTNKISNTAIPIITEDGIPFNINNGKQLVYQNSSTELPLWVSGQNVWQLTYNGKQIKAKLVCNNLPKDVLVQKILYWEKGKTIFIINGTKGLLVIKEKCLRTKRRDISNYINCFYAQIALDSNSILTQNLQVIGTSNNGILPIKRAFGNNVYTLSDSSIWYNHHDSAFRYDNKSKTSQFVTKFYCERLVVAEVSNEVYIIDATGIKKIINHNSTVEYVQKNKEADWDYRPLNALTYVNNTLLISTPKNLIQYHVGNNQLDTLLKTVSGEIRGLLKFKDYLLIGTYGDGYYVMKNGTIKAMPLDKHNYLKYTHCFIEDNFGYCYISTNKGLFKASLDDIKYAFDNNAGTIYYHYYGKNDGMSITEMNGGCEPCALRLNSQTISFPTMDGLLWVNPKNYTTLLPDGKIYIDEINIDNTPFSIDSFQNTKLPNGTRDIAISIAYDSWTNIENINLQYQINTHPNEWINLDPEKYQNTIRLYDLTHGNYTITIRKLNGFGINNYTYTNIHFTIATPWFRQWLFYILCLIGLLGLLKQYLRYRTNKYIQNEKDLEEQVATKTYELQEQNNTLEKSNRINTRLISIVSHDIITPLKFMHNAAKNIQNNYGKIPDDLKLEIIEEIANTSSDLELLSTNILNWIKYQHQNRLLVKEHFNLHDLTTQVINLLTSTARQKQINLQNDIPQNEIVFQYAEPIRIILFNLIINSLNFSNQETTVKVSCSNMSMVLSVIITDQGVGMTQQQINNIMAKDYIISSVNVDDKKGNGLGYIIIKDLLEIIEGSMLIESAKTYGTIVRIMIPNQ